jgi:NAD-dependent DNA ligase
MAASLSYGSHFRKLLIILFLVAFLFSSVISTLVASRSYAVTCDTDFYSSNDIIFYNPCEDGGGTSCTTGLGTLDEPAPNALSGESNAEKVWNYFIVRGLTPVAAAGAMGNIDQESSFNPLVQEGGSGIGFGLIQWSFERRTKLEAAAAAQGVSFAPGADSDAALLFQLNWLWDGEYGTQQWQPQVNAETKIEGDPTKHNTESIFYGRTVVFTGALSSMVRAEAQQTIADIGGTLGNGVTKETDFLVVGQQDYRVVGEDGMSSKQKKAISLIEKGSSLEILSEDDFLKCL